MLEIFKIPLSAGRKIDSLAVGSCGLVGLSGEAVCLASPGLLCQA